MSPTLDGGGPSGLPSVSLPDSTLGRVLQLAQFELQDATGVKWPVAKMVPYLNLTLQKIVNLKPDAYNITTTQTLVAGATQSIATTDILLMDAVCNMGSTGTTVGGVILSIDKQKMDQLMPRWMEDDESLTVSYVIKDDRTPKTFYVYPPNTGGQVIRVVKSVPPPTIEDADGIFPMDGSYIPAAVDGLVSLALFEETTLPNAQAKAQVFDQKFIQDLGLKSNTEAQVDAKGK